MFHRFLWLCLRLLAQLPFRVLYRLSDMLYLVLRFVFSYRKKIIDKNLTIAFPEKSRAERRKIRHRFYRWFSDFLMETIKLFQLDTTQLQQRMQIIVPPSMQEYFTRGQSVILVLGHYGQWEMANAAHTLAGYHRMWAVYQPLSSPFADKAIGYMRQRTGSVIIPVRQTIRQLTHMLHTSQIFALGLAADQATKPLHAIRVSFMGQETFFKEGPEKLSRRYDLPVYFMEIVRQHRGYYRTTYQLLYDGREELPHGEITARFAQALESQIREKPECWLWSHNRWKYSSSYF